MNQKMFTSHKIANDKMNQTNHQIKMPENNNKIMAIIVVI